VSTATVRATSFTDDYNESVSPEAVKRDRAELVWCFSQFLKQDLFMSQVVQATASEDIAGTEYWIAPKGGSRVSVDVMRRRAGSIKNWRLGEVEVTVELESRIEDSAPSKYGKEAGPDCYVYLFDDVPQVAVIVDGAAMRRAFQAGKFDPYLRRTRTVQTFRGDYQQTWTTSNTFLTISELKATVPGVFVLGNYKFLGK
jgi:hypothetical protein